MKIPYVIDNQKYKLSDILNAILENHQGQSMDVVTAYFNIQGYNLLKFFLLDPIIKPDKPLIYVFRTHDPQV